MLQKQFDLLLFLLYNPRKMSYVAFKRVFATNLRGERYSKRIAYKIFTLEEARERGIEPVEHWREAFFHRKEDLTGKYILTDDDPPLVTPIARCYFSPGFKGRAIELPWTRFRSKKAIVLFGKKAGINSPYMFKQKIDRANLISVRLFILLFALGVDERKLVRILWGASEKIEEDYLLRYIMKSERFESAAKDLAYETFSEIGISPKDIAKRLMGIIDDKKNTPVELQAELCQYIFGLLGIKEETEVPQMTGFFGQALLPEPSQVPERQRIIEEQVKRLKTKIEPEKVIALEEARGETVPEG